MRGFGMGVSVWVPRTVSRPLPGRSRPPGRPRSHRSQPAQHDLRRGRPTRINAGDAIIERWIATLRRECLDHLPITAAPVLLVRGTVLDSGTVLENGRPRFFRGLTEGVFDEDELRGRVNELAKFLREVPADAR